MDEDFFIKRNALDRALEEKQDELDAQRRKFGSGSLKYKEIGFRIAGIETARRTLDRMRAYGIPEGIE